MGGGCLLVLGVGHFLKSFFSDLNCWWGGGKEDWTEVRLLLNSDCISQTGCERDECGVAIGGCAAESFKMEEIQVCQMLLGRILWLNVEERKRLWTM